MKELLKDICRTFNPYLWYRKHCPVKKKTILYEAFEGRGMSCGPYALFHYLYRQEKYCDYLHVWVIADFRDNQAVMKEYEKASNVIFVRYKSCVYYKWLAQAEYLINNSTFPQIFAKRDGQTYVNTWHGIPLKCMGYDMPNGSVNSANTVRNFLQADYLLSPNEFHSQMYIKSYKLEGLFGGKVLEEGQVRCDVFFQSRASEIREKLRRIGVPLQEGRRLIVYAPTWKGSNFSHPQISQEEYTKVRKYLTQYIDNEKYQILIKPHQAVYAEMKRLKMDMSDMIPAIVDTNELLSIVDILISDYSSIFYDFLVTGRPILFYIPDLKEYEENRGLYRKIDELPGPVTASLEKLAEMIREIDERFAAKKNIYGRVRDWACPNDDGKACDRVIKRIFNKTETQVFSKKKILFFLGALRSYGITYSLIGLLKNIDYSKYDVTMYVYSPANDEEKSRIEQLPQQVRVLVHTKAPLGNPLETFYFLSCYNKAFVKDVGEHEYRRMFGEAVFDYVIDYVGYSPLFAAVAVGAPTGIKSIWQHNDMLAEYHKKVKGKYVNRGRLKKVFSLYPCFDHIISCSRQVMQVNQKNLESKYSRLSFRYVSNPLDLNRIEKNETSIVTVRDLVTEDEIPIEDGKMNFVNMGRLSPEKNQCELIEAMKLLVESGQDNVRLFILGDGPLCTELTAKVVKYQLQGVVVLCGNMENPFALMKHCYCFVLPSLHEGQPISVLEARTLGLGIVVSSFSTVDDILLKDGQILCGFDRQSIYKALLKAIEDVPIYSFSGKEYNIKVMKEFYAAIGK